MVARIHHNGTLLVMKAARRAEDTPRTIRFPSRLRARIGHDAERCNRSFEAQVVAILRRHYGEDVDIAPTPDFVLELARASLADLPAADQRALLRKLTEDDG
jgi:hypothetical protein